MNNRKGLFVYLLCMVTVVSFIACENVEEDFEEEMTSDFGRRSVADPRIDKNYTGLAICTGEPYLKVRNRPTINASISQKKPRCAYGEKAWVKTVIWDKVSKQYYARLPGWGNHIVNGKTYGYADWRWLKSTKKGFKVLRKEFYDNLRAKYGNLSQSQVDGINALLNKMEADTRPTIDNRSVWIRQIAYLFATTKHEVANTYQPITEYSNVYCKKYDGGCTYKGRGYVQLTHKYNYKKLTPIVGVDLVTYPTKVLEPSIAYTVMSYGMYNGMFTGRKLGTYIKSGTTDYYNARRVVNGIDRAQLLANYAVAFQGIMDNATVNK